MDIILRVDQLSKSFGSRVAVDRISFQVPRGEVMGLLGPNGAGKTTAIRMIMGILSADHGRIEFAFNGVSNTLDKTKIGYLPEERGLYDDVKVIDNLLYLSELKDKPRRETLPEAKAWLKRLDLDDYINQKMEKLSKGMQQKVQFIASILHHPQLVLFDEPFSGLDPINQDFLIDIIHELTAEGVTVLLSAHQMNLVEELCSSIFLIHNGREVLSGKLLDIKKSYQEHVVELYCDPNGSRDFLRTVPGIRVVRENRGQYMLRYKGTASVAELMQLLSSKLAVESIAIKKPPLHEIFIETVKQKGGDNYAVK